MKKENSEYSVTRDTALHQGGSAVLSLHSKYGISSVIFFKTVDFAVSQ